MARYTSLLVFALLTFAAASFAGAFEPGAWYEGLRKPDWTPPNWLFGPVWTLLYVMIALAGWLVWRAQGLGLPLLMWFSGLGFNAAWSYLMFGEHRIDAALVDLSLMWVTILAFILSARRVSPAAAALFVPYLLWVSFAGALNFALLQMNS
ncbi:MAG: TspO/MBR family protein [Hyphomicrobiaceae bacterium]|nr:TspO/MBR family protein [Hyphomicrobiaceae bacterium]